MIDSRLLDCDTQPKIEENFNRLTSLQNADFGSNVWIVSIHFFEKSEEYVPVRVVKKGSELPYAFALASEWGGFNVGMLTQAFSIRRDVDITGYYYFDEERGEYTLVEDHTITDLMEFRFNNKLLHIDLKSGYFLMND